MTGMVRRRHHWRMSVRTRALAAVIALAALAMAAAGVTAYSLERDHAGEIVDDTLARSASEIRTLIDQGVDPSTGAPFDSVDAVIRAALSHVVPAPNERSEEHTSELQSRFDLVCRLLLE